MSQTPHPCTRWFEWDGTAGVFRYYDKAKKEKVRVPLPVVFLLLDELACVKGWHEKSQSGISSNEVRDTRSEPMVVKAFEGGVIASGFYADIRDRVAANGGHYVANCYIAFKDGNELKLGSVQFKGAALQQWMEFKKTCPSRKVGDADVKEYWLQAIAVKTAKSGKKGNIEFRTPVFTLQPCAEATNDAAKKVEAVLTSYLTQYFARTKSQQAAQPSEPEHEQQQAPADSYDAAPDEPPIDTAAADEAAQTSNDQDVPF